MKTTFTLMAIALAAFLRCGGRAAASDFDLGAMRAADVSSVQADLQAPAPQTATDDDMIGVDMNIRVPFSAMKVGVGMIPPSKPRLTVIDPAAPIVSRAGEFLKLSNITVDAGGIIFNPVLTLKPYVEARDTLAIRIQRVQIHVLIENSSKSAGVPEVSQEELVGQVMDMVIQCVDTAVNKMLDEHHIPMRAEEVISLKYDKDSWTLRATLSSKIMREFVPANLVGDLHLTGLSVSDTGINLQIATTR